MTYAITHELRTVCSFCCKSFVQEFKKYAFEELTKLAQRAINEHACVGKTFKYLGDG